jgi:AcrR family transcriptional regulator
VKPPRSEGAAVARPKRRLEPGIDGKSRQRDAERTKEDIIRVATKEIADHGLSGARIDAIAEDMHTTKRMIYYYFGSKEGLYRAVLSKAYGDIRSHETALELDSLDPETALRRLIGFTFDYHDEHPDFVRLVMNENVHHAEHLAASVSIRDLNKSAIQVLSRILARGAGTVFTHKVEPIDVHLLISGFCFFRVSNQPTFSTIFQRALSSPAVKAAHRRLIADTIVALLKSS